MSSAISKVSQQQIKDAIADMLAGSKARKFQQTCELQVGLKDYDPQKDKRFAGTVRLPHVPRNNLKICIIGDQKHIDEAKGLNVDVMDLDGLKKFNKEKKLIKKWAKKYQVLLATDTLVKQIPKVLGPVLNKINRFPQVITHNEPLKQKVEDVRASIKFQLKKVLCMSVAMGHEKMTDEQLRQNLTMSINFLVSLTKKGWQNIKTLTIKTTMGKPVKLYG